MSARVSVVVLSYDRPELLAQALPSLESQHPSAVEIIVVDNPSPSSPAVDAVLAGHPGVRLIRPSRNVGFAAGMNAGLRAATGERVLLTEDDLLLEPGALAALGAHLDANPSCGLCAGLMLNHAAGTVRAAGMQLDLGGVYRQALLRADAPDPGPGGAPVLVDAVPGAGVFGRRTELIGAGGFREDYFMYYEDVELCLRLRRMGLTIAVVPAARMRHFEPPPGTATQGLEFHKLKNLFVTCVLHAPARVLPGFAIRYGPVAALRALGTPGRAATVARAWLWVLWQLPVLLAQRATLPGRPPVPVR